MKIPDNYCPTCTQKALAKIDLETEASDMLRRIKNAIAEQGAFGGPKAALAEVCYLVDMPMPVGYARVGIGEREAGDLLVAIARNFRRLFFDFIMRSRIGEEVMRAVREHEERVRRDRMDFEARMRMRSYDPGRDMGPTTILQKDYYVPEYRVKENKR